MTADMLGIEGTARDVVGRAILITGTARSGTTMMGGLVQSLDGVEYIFEPPVLYTLMPLIDRISAPDWQLLYETYLFEDVLLETLGGRRLNFNIHNDSHIHRTKSEDDIRKRLSKSRRRHELVAQAQASSIAYKMAGMIPFLPSLITLFPAMTAIVMLRRPDHVIASVLAKGWFADRSLRETPGVWPFRHHGGLAVPFWVPVDEIESWAVAGEMERCARYYLYMYEPAPPPSAIVIDYDAFVAAPVDTFGKLVARLGRTAGPKTAALLNEVAPQPAKAPAPPDGIPAALTERMDNARAQWADGNLIGSTP